MHVCFLVCSTRGDVEGKKTIERKDRPCFNSGSQTETRQMRTGGWESLQFIFLGSLSAFIGWQIQLIPGEMVREKLQPTQRWSLLYLRSWQTETFVSWALVVVSLVFFCRTGFIPGDRIRFDRRRLLNAAGKWLGTAGVCCLVSIPISLFR